MFKKTVYTLLIGILTIALTPSLGLCRRGYYGGHGYYNGGHHHNDGWVWGLGGLVVGSALTAAALQPPPRQVVYGPPTPTYSSYKPDIPPGMCRWERTVLDNYGRVVYNRYGYPVLEYTIGSCQYPPN